MDQLSSQDTATYKKLQRDAKSNVLAFRRAARESAEQYPRPLRQVMKRVSTRDTSSYVLLEEWSTKVAPEVKAIESARRSAPLSSAIAKHLGLSKLAAVDVTKRLVDERITDVTNTFLNRCYGNAGRARASAFQLLSLPVDEVNDMHSRFLTYHLYMNVAHEQGMTIYDSHAPILKRVYQNFIENRQIQRYKKQQYARLSEIAANQRELKQFNTAIVARVLSLDLAIEEVLVAYEKYEKRLEALKPASRTPEKRLALFASATEKIRKDLTSKQTATEKLADLQDKLESIDRVLIELFDMSKSQHKKLLAYLHDYKKLDRESARIKKELAAYAN